MQKRTSAHWNNTSTNIKELKCPFHIIKPRKFISDFRGFYCKAHSACNIKTLVSDKNKEMIFRNIFPRTTDMQDEYLKRKNHFGMEHLTGKKTVKLVK